jgi:hypothetical protein
VHSESDENRYRYHEKPVRKARKLTCLKRKRQIVEALELLVRSESRKGILRYYGSGIWKGDPSPWGEIEFDLGDPRSRSIVRCGSISWVLLRPVPVSNCGA